MLNTDEGGFLVADFGVQHTPNLIQVKHVMLSCNVFHNTSFNESTLDAHRSSKPITSLSVVYHSCAYWQRMEPTHNYVFQEKKSIHSNQIALSHMSNTKSILSEMKRSVMHTTSIQSKSECTSPCFWRSVIFPVIICSIMKCQITLQQLEWMYYMSMLFCIPEDFLRTWQNKLRRIHYMRA